jgi:hypothetical protein
MENSVGFPFEIKFEKYVPVTASLLRLGQRADRGPSKSIRRWVAPSNIMRIKFGDACMELFFSMAQGYSMLNFSKPDE